MSEDIERMIADVVESEELPQPSSTPGEVAVQQILNQPLFEDDEMLALCSEAVANMRGDRKQLDTLISNFVEMVFNEGESSTASKEALVALMVAKTNMSDKQLKMVDLIAKFKLKEMADAPKTLTASSDNRTRRSFLEQIDKRIKKKKTEEKKNA